MIEAILIAYLNRVLSVPVYAEIPKDAPDAFCIVERVGGGEENHIQTAEIIIQSYDTTLYKAALLDKAVRQAMSEAVGEPQISSVSLNSSTNFTDKQYRYQSLFDITFYEED